MTVAVRTRILCVLGFISLSVLLSSCLARPGSVAAEARTLPPRATTKSAPADLLAVYAERLGVSENELENYRLYQYIDDWMGAPHRLGGTNKKGIDCSAFIHQLYQQVYGHTLPRASYEMAGIVKRKYENQLKEGDLVFFSFGKRQVDHVGLYLGNNKFVHVSTSKGVIISDLHETWFYRYFVRAGQVK